MQIELNTDEIVLLEELLTRHRLDVLEVLIPENNKRDSDAFILKSLVNLLELNKKLTAKITGNING
jgi:hypothetical protein